MRLDLLTLSVALSASWLPIVCAVGAPEVSDYALLLAGLDRKEWEEHWRSSLPGASSGCPSRAEAEAESSKHPAAAKPLPEELAHAAASWPKYLRERLTLPDPAREEYKPPKKCSRAGPNFGAGSYAAKLLGEPWPSNVSPDLEQRWGYLATAGPESSNVDQLDRVLVMAHHKRTTEPKDSLEALAASGLIRRHGQAMVFSKSKDGRIYQPKTSITRQRFDWRGVPRTADALTLARIYRADNKSAQKRRREALHGKRPSPEAPQTSHTVDDPSQVVDRGETSSRSPRTQQE